MANTSADSNVTEITDDEFKEKNVIAKNDLKEEILGIAVLKREEKRRYGNLQISLKTHIFSGKILTQIPSWTC